ncbi:MAG TPA: glycosyltransferase family 39 protein, partial [Anaerolineae bacterium]
MMKRFDHRAILAFITLGGLFLRVIQLDFQPLWWDEGYSLFFATRDLATLLERTAVDIHPPLYYVLLKLWMMLAGQSETAVRLFSVAIGVAAIPLLYLLAIKLFADRRIALIAALFLAISPLHIYYSQEVRMYGLVTLFGLVSVILLVQLLDMPPGKPKTAITALAYILATTAALYTQYYAAFILAFEVLLVIAHAFISGSQPSSQARVSSDSQPDEPIGSRLVRALRSTEGLTHWIAAWATILVLYAPWLIYAGGKLVTYISAKKAIEKFSPLDPLTFLAQHLAAFSTGHLTTLTGLAWGSLLLVGMGALGFAAMWERSRSAKTHSPLLSSTTAPWVVALYLAVPILCGYAVNLIYPFHPVHNERLLLLAMPAFLLLVAFGLNALWNR